MKIIFVSEFAESASNSTGLFVGQICKIAEGAGYCVHVVSCDVNDSSVSGGKSTVRLPLERLLKKLRPLYWFLLSVRLALQAYGVSSKGDVIIVASNPLFLPLIIFCLGFIFRRRTKALLLFDIFPLNAIATEKLKSEAWVTAALVWVFDRAYSAFDAIIVNGRDCLDVINRWKSSAECRLIYVPHFLSEEHFPPRGTDANDLATKDQLIVQYLGNAGPMQGLHKYAPLMIGLLSEIDTLHLAMFGSAACYFEADMSTESAARKLKVSPEVTFEDRHLALVGAEYGLVTLAPGMRGLAVPSKAWFALAAGQGLIVFGDAGSELDLVLSENPRLGVFVASDQLDEAIARIKNFIARDRRSWEARKKLGATFLQGCQQDALKSYTALFNDLASVRLSEDGR